MWLAKLRNLVLAARTLNQPVHQRRRTRLRLEQLEGRALPAAFTAASVSDLIADINAANAAGGSNTITLAAGSTFTLTAANNATDGPTGLPVIAANDNLIFRGNGDTVSRSSNAGTPAFRLLDVAAGASLTLENMTLQGGLALDSVVQADGTPIYVWAEGGAIYNQGALTLSGVTMQKNTAQGLASIGYGGPAAGGGIYSGGSLTVQSSTVQYNQALGGEGNSSGFGSGFGGSGAGGGIFIAGGTAALDNITLYSNTAQGGDGGSANGRQNAEFGGKGFGGDGLGGGLYVAGGTVSLNGTSANHNTAKGGHGQAADGVGQGGGFYFAATTSVLLDAFTQAHTTHNSASTSDPDIFGFYTLSP